MTETLVRVEQVSKKFCRSLGRSLWYGLQDLGNELRGHVHHAQGELRPDEFWAVRDVSFDLRRGECLGLIGSNGAGKTTLLRMLNGLIKPDAGRIEMRGRTGALIALGAGFHPLLTGRENIFVNAAVLGFDAAETRRRFDEIVEFSGVGEFIDAPVQSYSSGMQVRLGFAIAAHTEPDVLLLDEVLAVGDANFRARCYRRISAIRESAAIILVSHNMEQVVRVARDVLWLERGRLHFIGPAEVGAQRYEDAQLSGSDGESFVSEQGGLRGCQVTVQPGIQRQPPLPLEITLTFESDITLEGFVFRVWIYSAAGAYAAEAVVPSTERGIRIKPGPNCWRLQLDAPRLRRGDYAVSVFIISADKTMLLWAHRVAKLRIDSDTAGRVADYQLQCGSWTASDAAPGSCA